MRYGKKRAEFYAPDDASSEEIMKRAHIMGVGAHPDDLEIMATPGIVDSFNAGGKQFFGVILTNGGGSMRSGNYAGRSYMEMQDARMEEQKHASDIGMYSGLLFLEYESSEIKDTMHLEPSKDLKAIFEAVQPEVIYLHHPFDRHDTHIATLIRCISAIRAAIAETGWMPKQVYGAEGWNALDWLSYSDRSALPVKDSQELTNRLIQAYQSQMMVEKSFDIAAKSRRVINASYQESSAMNMQHEMVFAVDMMPLFVQPQMKIEDFSVQIIHHFQAEVASRIDKYAKLI